MPASERLARAIVATDLVAQDAEGSRAARLARLLAGRPRPATSLADLDSAPRWLRRDIAARQRLACLVGLVHAAPAIARSIDGAILRALATLVGAEALDWAIALGAATQSTERPMPDAPTIEAEGLAILAMTLPPALAARLAAGPAPTTLAAAHAAVAAALDWDATATPLPAAVSA